MNILVIKSSVFGDNGNSSALVNAQVDALKAKHPQATVRVRDLSTDPIPHLDGNRVSAFFTSATQRTDEQQAIDAFSLALIDEIKAADHIVLGLPMFNPSANTNSTSVMPIKPKNNLIYGVTVSLLVPA